MLRAHHVIVLAVIALLSLGVVMVNSAGMSVGQGASIRSVLTARSSVYLVLAVGAMLVAWGLPIRRLAVAHRVDPDEPARGLSMLMLGGLMIVAALLLVYVPGLSRSVNGSSRWIGLTLPGVGLVSCQPSEVAKWATLALVAWAVTSRRALLDSFRWGLGPILLTLGVIIVLVVKEDLGTGVLIAAGSGLVLLAGGARIRHLLAVVPLGIAGLVGAVAIEPYRLARLTTFFTEPYSDPQGAGYHMIQSMATVAGGGALGVGLGNGVQKFGYLPEDTTDFLFAIIAEELGLPGVGLVIAAFLALLWATLRVASRERDPMLRLVALGVGVTVTLQAIINIAVVTGWAPTKGIPLPLVSSGGTGWILTATALGVVASIGRSQPARVVDHAAQAEQLDDDAQLADADFADADESWDDDASWDEDESAAAWA